MRKDAGPGPAGGGFLTLDACGVTRFHWKIMVVAGMGVFTGAYDLLVIGIVVALLKPEWALSTGQISLLNSVTLAAAAIGAVIFGRIADIFGRKRTYGYAVLVLAVGAIASALSPNYTFLLVCRVIIGIGIGGDYPVSATIMSEYSGKRSRGRMVGLVCAMQGAGLVAGPLAASVLLASGLSDGYTWRILLALGAVPAVAVCYLRRQIHETPRFALAGGADLEAEIAVAEAIGVLHSTGPAAESTARLQHGIGQGFRLLVRRRQLLTWLIATSAAWFLLDFCYYGNTISTPRVLSLLSPHASLLQDTLAQLAIFIVFALPGYAAAVLLMDSAGRKGIQILGFAMMAAGFGLTGIVPGVTGHAAPFIMLYGISYFFTEFGPNTTTFIYPAEIFPLQVRTTGHGISAAAGQLGAFAGAFLFPVMLASPMGVRGAEVVAAAASAAGLALTARLLPEPKGKSLEDLSPQADAAPIRDLAVLP